MHMRAVLSESPPDYKSRKPFNRAAESVKIRNGLVSTLHACVCIVSVLSWFAHYSFDPWDWQSNMQGGVSVAANANGHDWYGVIASNTIGYFIYDFLCMVWYHRVLGNTGSYVHHIVLSIAMAVGVSTGLGRSYHCLYVLEEFSTPALNMKNLYQSLVGTVRCQLLPVPRTVGIDWSSHHLLGPSPHASHAQARRRAVTQLRPESVQRSIVCSPLMLTRLTAPVCSSLVCWC